MDRAARIRWATAAALSLAAPVGLSAQESRQAREAERAARQLDAMPPPVRLGARAALLRRSVPALDTLVIVPDGGSFVEAVARWSTAGHYPVLIDDGSDAAREDIARFVRGFEPRRVLRWSAGDAPAFPADPAARERALDDALRRAWRPAEGPPPDSTAALIASLRARSLAPPGIVLADPQDSSWPAALALAAGRGQPIVWTRFARNVDASMSRADADEIALAAERACESLGLEWRALGDEIDAVTIVGHAAVKLIDRGDDRLALTDYVGRLPADRARGERWAWAGQVFGSEPQAAYRAMAALFIQPRSAWLVDGYPKEEPWSAWSCADAAQRLESAGVRATVDAAAGRTPDALRARVAAAALAGGVDAGLVFINSKGNADFFELLSGRALPGDLPFLRVPAIAHVVHSWSLLQPGMRRTVGGRFIERGVYAYFGSVHEPYLQAFLPTPMVAARMLAGAAWGAAPRHDDGPAWRLAVIGDPLIVIARVPDRRRDDPPLDGAQDVDAHLRDALRDRSMTSALRDLALLGRDSDAARLARSMLREQPALVDGGVARAALMPAMRAGDTDTFFGLYRRLDQPDRRDPVLLDALWHASGPALAAGRRHPALALLREGLREDQYEADAEALARALLRAEGGSAARAMLAHLRDTAADPGRRDRLDRLIREVTGR